MKQQIIIVHGGSPYDTYEEYLEDLRESPVDLDRLLMKGWKDTLPDKLGGDYQVVQLEMPNPANAKYLEWQIYFDNARHFFADEAIFLGHSLGAIFLAKYFSENDYAKKFRSVILLAAPFSDQPHDGMADFYFTNKLEKLAVLGSKVSLYHSKDDPIVTFSDLSKFRKLLPRAQVHEFGDKGHFIGSDFPEMVLDIQNIRR